MKSDYEYTYTVAECGEFPQMGEYQENIKTQGQALAYYISIPPERMNGIPTMFIRQHKIGTPEYEDVDMPVIEGRSLNYQNLEYYKSIADEPSALKELLKLEKLCTKYGVKKGLGLTAEQKQVANGKVALGRD